MRKIFTLVLLLVSTIVLVACTENGVDVELASPKNVAISNGVVTWSAVDGADEYTIVVGTRSFTTTLTTFDLKNENIMVGTHTVTVLTVKDGKSSLPSTGLSYTVVGANLSVVLDDVLYIIDPSYSPDMTEDDFDDEWEYRNYQNMLKLSSAYSNAAVNVGMSEDDAVGFFGDFYLMASTGMEDIENLSALMTELEMFENNNMTPYAMAYVLYELILVSLEIQIEDSQAYIDEESDDLDAQLLLINNLKAQATYLSAYTKFMSYTTVDNADLAMEFFAATNNDLYNLAYEIRYVAQDFFYNGYSNAGWYSYNVDIEYAEMLVDVIGAAYMSGDNTYIQSLMNSGIPALLSVYDASNNYNWQVDNLLRQEENILLMIEALDALETNEIIVVASLEVVIDFLMTFKNSMPQNVISLFDDLIETGILTTEEYFIIKDGIVGVLIDTLPSAEDFAVLHTAIFYIGGAVSGVSMTPYLEHAGFLGELDFAYFDLILALVADMDQATFEDILAIIDEIQVEELVYDPYWGYTYTEYTTDPSKVVELAVYVLTYIDSFVVANQAKVDSLSALLDDDAMEDLFALVIEQVKAQVENDMWMDEEEIELITNMLDDLVADYAHIKAGLAVFEEIGVNLIDEFIATEGALFIKLIELEDMVATPETMIAAIEDILALFVGYNTIFVDGMTQADIQLVLRMIKVPVLFAIAQENPDDDYSATFDQLLPFVANVISNLLTVEQKILEVANAMDISDLVLTQYAGYEEAGMIAALFEGLDLVLTPSIEALITQTVTIVIDNILKNVAIMELHGISLLELNDLKAMINDTLDEIFAEVHIIAQYDFANLTIEQESRIEDLMELLSGLFLFSSGSTEPF